MIYFTSDTHFGADRTLKFSKRPFDSVFEMDATMIKNWNKVVGEKDLIYHLGDFGSTELTKYLKGRLILLSGNYEEPNEALEALKPFCEDIIRPNYEMTCRGEPNLRDGQEVTLKLVHKPEDAFGRGFFLYGHIHKLQMIKKNGLNVGTDCHNFTPISFEDVLFYKNAIENHYDVNVFMKILGDGNGHGNRENLRI